MELCRVRLADGVPVAVETAVLAPRCTATVVCGADLETGSLHEALIGAGILPSRGQGLHRRRGGRPRGCAVCWGCATGEPMLVERRLILDQRGRPLERTESRYAASRYGLNVGFSVEDSGAVTVAPRSLNRRLARPQGGSMEPRDRVLTALDHREADRVPRDLAGTRYSSIHAEAYARLRPALGLPEAEITIVDTTQGLAHVHDDVLDRFGADVALVASGAPSGYRREVVSDGEYERFVDEWGVVRARPIGGLYYESSTAPLTGVISSADVSAFAWPDPQDPGRFVGMAERARHIREVEQRAVFVGSLCAGVTEMHFRLRGYEDGYMDLAADPALARQIMEKVTELKLAYWEKVLDEFGDLIDIAAEADDLGAQHAPLFSPADLPRDRQAAARRADPLHQEPLEGALLPALLRRHPRPHPGPHRDRRRLPESRSRSPPTGMDTATLKTEFGKDITFWGGTVDPQGTLARGTPDEVRAEARRRIGDLKPGGGFVFASIHNMQAHVPVENILALWEALDEAGTYGG